MPEADLFPTPDIPTYGDGVGAAEPAPKTQIFAPYIMDKDVTLTGGVHVLVPADAHTTAYVYKADKVTVSGGLHAAGNSQDVAKVFQGVPWLKDYVLQPSVAAPQHQGVSLFHLRTRYNLNSHATRSTPSF